MAGLGVGIMAVKTHGEDIDKFNNRPNTAVGVSSDGKCATMLEQKGSPYCQTLYNHAERMKQMAYLGFGGAAVAGITAAVLFVSADSGPELAAAPARQLALTCAPTLATPGGTCAFRF